MPRKILWIDTETTGLSPWKNDVIQIAAIAEVGEQIEVFEHKLAPSPKGEIAAAALEVHGFSVEELMEFPPQAQGIKAFISWMSKYVDRFDKNDKFVVAGYYVGFDMDFLRSAFKKVGEGYFGSWFFSPVFDVQGLIAHQIMQGLRLKDYKLATVCAHFGIELRAHMALSDIKATRELAYKLFE